MRFFLRFIITVVIIYILIQFKYLDGIQLVNGTQSLLIFIFILGLVNLVIGGLLRLITLPIRFLSLGIIGFIISIVIVMITDNFFEGVTLQGWISIFIIALVMGIISSIFS